MEDDERFRLLTKSRTNGVERLVRAMVERGLRDP